MNHLLCDNLEGWDELGVGRRLGGREHAYTYDWFTLLYGRNQHNILKQLSSNYKQIFKKNKMNICKPLELSLTQRKC